MRTNSQKAEDLFKITKDILNGKLPPANIYLFNHNRNIKKVCEICSKLTIKTPERSGVVIVNF